MTDFKTRKYFLPALWIRFAGAIALGMIYQFYYNGGDTFNYFNQGSIVYEAFLNKPVTGAKLLFANEQFESDIYEYSSRIYWYRSSAEFFIVKVVGFLSIFTFHTYTSIAIFFASFSFFGSWLTYSLLQEKYTNLREVLVICILFIPSTILWGSGILKDTLTLGALGYAFWAGFRFFYEGIRKKRYLVILIIASLVLYQVKLYVLVAFIPLLVILWYFNNISSIKNPVVKIIRIPILITLFGFIAFFLIEKIADSSSIYSLDNLAQRVYITSYDIGFYSGRDAGSSYDLGSQDGTWQGLIPLLPSAINVTLFRPYLWEVKNPLMLLSSLESATFLMFTILVAIRCINSRFKGLTDPLVISLLVFCFGFAFAVGVSTYNFGSLSRYKIPLMSFYLSAIFILNSYAKSKKFRKESI